MHRDVGVGFVLSLLVVGAVAIGLDQPEPPASPDGPDVEPISVSAEAEPVPERPFPAPPATPGVPLADVPDGSFRPLVPGHRPDSESPARLTRVSSSRSPSVRSPARPLLPPRSIFTQVAEDETLSDVALRVYGSPESAPALWMANRDLLEQLDSPLRSGMLLRTPLIREQ